MDTHRTPNQYSPHVKTPVVKDEHRVYDPTRGDAKPDDRQPEALTDPPTPTRTYPRVIEADGLSVTVHNEGEEAHFLAAKGRREKAEAEAKRVEASTPPPAPARDPDDEAVPRRRT